MINVNIKKVHLNKYLFVLYYKIEIIID